MNVTTALENLIIALDNFRNEEGVSKAIEDSIKVLGYDPSISIHNYAVTLVLEIDAADMSEAVKQAVNLITDNRAEIWSYIVEDENGKKAEIGGWEVV